MKKKKEEEGDGDYEEEEEEEKEEENKLTWRNLVFKIQGPDDISDNVLNISQPIAIRVYFCVRTMQ